MTRPSSKLWPRLGPLVLLLALSLLIVALVSGGENPAAARSLFQSVVDPPTDSPLPTPTLPPPTPIPPPPTPEPPTATPEPPTPIPLPPTATPEPSVPTPEPPTPTPEPAAIEPAATEEPAPEPTPLAEPTPEVLATPESIHLPALESGEQQAQPLEGATEADAPSARPADPAALAEEALSPEEAARADTVRLIDGLAVLFSYGWLACGVLLLVLVPVGLFVLNRWGKRRRE